MGLNITVRHMDLDDKMKDFIDSKMARIMKHLHRDIPVHLVIGNEKHLHVAEIQLHDKGIDYHSRADEVHLETAIEVAVDKLDKQILRHKDKVTKHTVEDKTI